MIAIRQEHRLLDRFAHGLPWQHPALGPFPMFALALVHSLQRPPFICLAMPRPLSASPPLKAGGAYVTHRWPMYGASLL